MRHVKINAIPRVPPRSDFETVLTSASKLSMVMLAVVATMAALWLGRVLIAPVALAIIIGLMFGPVASRLERGGIPPSLSAVLVVLLFLTLLLGAAVSFAAPLSGWFEKLPLIWQRLRAAMTDWQTLFQSVGELQDQLNTIIGSQATMTVEIEDASTVTSIAATAPTILAQIIIFLASLYFFVATRQQIRVSILSMCISRQMRWRAAHVFRDVELYVSRYLLSITLVNIGLGAAVALGMWAIGLPSPLLWGMLAAVLNYILYIGPATMALILAAVGLASFDSLQGAVAPPLVYLCLNFFEAQFITPHVIGRTLTLNPFMIFFCVAFWLWLWGPLGGLVAVPILLIGYAVLNNILPRRPVPNRRR